MNVLITGANGFIGKNMTLWLENNHHNVYKIDIDNISLLPTYLSKADFIIHLAGINRPLTKKEFYDGNTNLTKKLVDLVKETKKDIPIIYSSSIQAILDNDYGKSKLLAERYLLDSGLTTYIYRLSNVFGKWCRPNYNSAITTFCYNIAHNLPIEIRDNNYIVHLNYIDDICKTWLDVINGKIKPSITNYNEIKPIYDKSLKELADLIYSFKESRNNKFVIDQGDSFIKKLYATYLSYLPIDEFKYDLDMHIDNRGSFTEVLKTLNYGQISINVGKPGIIKGNHYHNTKNEKFLVISGTCSIKFRKIDSDEIIEYITSGDKLEVVDIPVGYTHSITNIGTTDSVTLMWANELFDKDNPDTYFMEVIKND